MAEHNVLGKEGEGEAVAYLQEKGYVIRHRNWLAGRLELDIVAEKDGELVVIEVKTRRNERYGRPEDAVDRVANLMGNSVKRLDHPNLITIFVGILVGIIFGSIPFAFPGVPTPVKLGLAGGPLIVAILIGRFGYKFHLVTYVSTSANLMLREFGLALFLASVGIKAGEHFVDTVIAGDGLKYVWTGFIITVIPILVIGLIARMRFKLNYFTIMGLIAGSTTDPPALAFANQASNSDAPAVGYSTVYPLTMFLRILTAQLIVLLLCSV